MFSKHKVGIKTVKRKVKPLKNYTTQVTAKHASEPVDYFFFLSYEIVIRRMWLLGGIDKDSFLKKAIYYAEGDFVHQDYQIRKGHEIFNIALTELILPDAWLSSLKNE